uniref:Dermokine n=1 Tax=Nannospalax galili TaxID=1026970 RepID=A0A8C6QED6_NANGA
MQLLGSLACLLLALCLGSGTANPLQNGGEGPWVGAAQGAGDAISHGVGEAVGQGAKEAVSSGIQDAFGQGHGGEGGSALSGARGDAFSHRLGEAAHSLENTGREAGRQAEDVIRRGVDAAHTSGSWGTSGGHGMFRSQGGVGAQGSPGVSGTPWDSESSFGTNSLGGSGGQGVDGGSFNYETNAQGAVAQPGYGSVRGSNQNSGTRGGTRRKGRGMGGSSGGGGGRGGGSSSSHGNGGSSSDGSSSHGSNNQGSSNSGHGGSSTGSRDIETSNFDEGYSVSRVRILRGTGSSSGSRGGSGGGNRPEVSGQEHGDSGRNEAINGVNTVVSLNFKSKMGFINWDAVDKGRTPRPSTRALLYFRRLWENFKRRTPFFNWKEIEASSLQKRAGGADQVGSLSSGSPGRPWVPLSPVPSNYYHNQQVQPTYSWQYYAKTSAKVSLASRAQPGLLKWLKFW